MNKPKNLGLFFGIVLLSCIVMFLSNYYLNNQELLYNFYSEKLAEEQLNQLLERQEQWYWLPYSIIPILILLRTSLVAFCLSVGVFFYNTEYTLKFKQLFKITLYGELILVLVGFFKFLYFFLIKDDYDLIDVQQFYPLSYTNFLDLNNIEPWLIYPLQTINLFEIAYFFVLVYGLNKLLKNKYSKSFEIVAVSYGSGLAIWLGLVMFLTLNMS